MRARAHDSAASALAEATKGLSIRFPEDELIRTFDDLLQNCRRGRGETWRSVGP
jgi:hypothetical protein